MKATRLFGAVLLISLAGCAAHPRSVVIDGKRVPAARLEFTGQPLVMTHAGSYPSPRGPSSGLRGNDGRITGQICGMDVEYSVQMLGDHAQLTGFIDGRFPSELAVRDLNGERLITGSLTESAGLGAVDLRLGSSYLAGRVGTRYVRLIQQGDKLAGTLRILGTDEPDTATINGRDALWAMPAADQAAALPNLLACFIAKIGVYGRSPLVVGLGGRAGALPHTSSMLYSP